MAYPTSPTPSGIKITSISPTPVSVSHSLKRQVRSRGGQRWLIELTYPPLTRADFAPLWAFSNSQDGQYTTFDLAPPVYGSTSGSASGTALVDNASGYSAGDSTIAVDGFTGTLKAGDFIKFASHDKIYQLTADATTSMTIHPNLVASIADDEVITYDSVQFTVAFADDKQDMSAGADGFVSYKASFVEVV